MNAFLMHVGHPGNVDIAWTVTRRRTLEEVIAKLPSDAPERGFFDGSTVRTAFPDGRFNCWGVPGRALPPFNKTAIGDLVLIVPMIGVHDGGVHQIGIVTAKCLVPAHQASRILWPKTPNDRLFPYLFFFRTEVGYRGWFQFLEDVGYDPKWHPRGWYLRVKSERFARWGGPEGYVNFLREQCGFRPLGAA